MINWLIASLPLLWESGSDWYFWKKGHKDKKKLDVLVRIALCFLMGVIIRLIDPSHTIIEGFFLSGGIFTLLFDDIMSLIIFKKLGQVGTTSQTDIKTKQWPYKYRLAARGAIFVIGVVLYYL